MSQMESNPDFLLGGRTSASAECRHWSGRAVRWSSCAILLSLTVHWRDAPVRTGIVGAFRFHKAVREWPGSQ